ncbi:pseudouridine synthase [Acetobacterium sp.]|uniref:pseudouridine synthase n=1 Tax=Acetobacterium sp. TaxID=1872094 RepID=UPI002F41A3FE
MRIQKYMAQCGVASRRKSEELVIAGLVMVNGVVVTTPGFAIDPEKDTISVNGRILSEPPAKIYIMINKPKGVLSTSQDTHGRELVINLIPVNERLYTVGRLDMETEGLLLLTNDGELTFRLTHPKHEFNKTYVGLVRGCPTESSLEYFRQGMDVEDYHTATAAVKILENYDEATLLEMIIHEGKKRQIRKMCGVLGHPIQELTRVAVGKLTLGDLEPGDWRYLREDEIEYLKGDEKSW